MNDKLKAIVKSIVEKRKKQERLFAAMQGAVGTTVTGSGVTVHDFVKNLPEGEECRVPSNCDGMHLVEYGRRRFGYVLTTFNVDGTQFIRKAHR